MTAVTDLMPLAGTLGGGFFIGLVAGYAIKKIIKIAAVIVGLFIAALAYMEYRRIIDVNWAKLQALSQMPSFTYRIILARVIQEHYQILVFH